MATLSTLGALMSQLGSTQFPQYDPLEVARQQNLVQGGRLQNQTSLLALEDLKRQQEAQAVARQAYQQDPSLLLGQVPVLGSLGPAGGPGVPGAAPAPGPITQSPFGPGGVTGPAQTIPAPMEPNANLGATGGRPMPTLATLGPPPQANPFEALVRQNPDAARLVMQQQQAVQDRVWKIQEQQLSMREKTASYIARQAQGVTSQESLDALRRDFQQAGLAQAAAALPQVYSKDAMAPFIAQGQSLLENAQAAQAQATAEKTRQQSLNEQYTREVLLPQAQRAMGGVGAGGEAPAGTGAASGQPAPPAEVETAVQEAIRQYPMVRPEIVRGIIGRESNFTRTATSSAGAQGYMQLMPATQREMGVKDPFDTRQNILGGVGYFDKLLTRYGGDERKALAAYNAGPGRVDAVGGDLTKLPAETQAYVPNVLQRAQVGATARGPATGPEAQQLRQEIAGLDRQLTAMGPAAMLSPGVNTYVDNLRQQLQLKQNRLDKLEEPQRALERETLISPLRQAEHAATGQRAKELELQAERDKTLIEAEGREGASKWRYSSNGEPVDPSMNKGEAIKQAGGKSPTIVALSDKQSENFDKIQSVLPLMQELRTALVRVYGPGGIFENLRPEDRAAASVQGGWQRFTQTNPDLAVYGRLIESNVDVIRRALQGQVGTQTEQDAVRGTGAFAKTTGVPDSQEVAYKMMDAFNSMVQGNLRTILRNPKYTHATLAPMTTTPTPGDLSPTQQRLLEKHTR